MEEFIISFIILHINLHIRLITVNNPPNACPAEYAESN